MMYDAEDKYADIIHLPHHVSRNHPQMSMADRAAQFSPFGCAHGTRCRNRRSRPAHRRATYSG